MKEKNLLTSLEQELRRGTIVLCVLSQMEKPRYGYSLVQALAEKGIEIEANTLYPLMRRLESQGLLESAWDTGESKPRKYYKRTLQGDQIYGELKTIWQKTARNMEQLWEGENDEQ